jgi:hypothetical protein
MRTLKFGTIGMTCLVLWYSCVSNDLYRPSGDLQINLQWTKSYPGESRSQITTGLMWNLSYLGAKLPKGSMKKSVHWMDGNMFSLDISALGFSESAIEAFRILFEQIKISDEYIKTGAIDLGRFTVLTLNSSYHYYAITGAASSLTQYRNQFLFSSSKAAIINSSIAKGHRVVSIADAEDISKLAFIAEEGTGSVEEENFVAQEFETLDIMPNGQLRFALYDKNGELKSAASEQLTVAGKPAKCIWCHEINMQSLNEMGSVPSYVTYEAFRDIIQKAKEAISRYRKGLSSDIDFSKTQDHTQGELIYIGFMEPSSYRLANEWRMSEDEVLARLKGLVTHRHGEFNFFGSELYHRKDVDQLAPYAVLAVPDDAREPSLYEPEIIRP